VAARLAVAVRPTDLTCRYGGEEFVVAMPECSTAAAADIGERLRAVMADSPIVLPGGPISLTVSIGIAVAALSHDPGYDRLLNAADRALYRVKASGRNRVEIADPSIPDAPSISLVAGQGLRDVTIGSGNRRT